MRLAQAVVVGTCLAVFGMAVGGALGALVNGFGGFAACLLALAPKKARGKGDGQ